jgi:hypothetical protein
MKRIQSYLEYLSGKAGKVGLAAVLLLFAIGVFLYGGSGDDQRLSVGTGTMPDSVDFNFHIRPILSDRCFACHGPDVNKQEAGLRLDLEKEAYALLKETKGVHAIKPGDPGASGVYQRIIAKDPNERMPPVSSNLTLSDYEIKLIEKWIRQGAAYQKHWAFLVPQKASLPEPKDASWPKNEIDYFTLEKMVAKGLKPNEPADKEHMLRRVSIDLTGLPPTVEEMDRFLSDESKDAYGKVVDRLLKSPAYGEKMALHWMDVSRYADSYGYQDDQWRTQWPWRDWVIHAFNENMPYSRFLTWQIAGDMLPGATKEQVLATGFGRNHKITEEQGVIDEEYRVNYVLDRTNTYSKGVLGITMECAQCHDHKFDPFSQKNYYQLFAFFNNTPDKGLEIANSLQSKPYKFPFMTIDRQDLSGTLRFINHLDTSALMVSVMQDMPERRKTFILDRGIYDAPRQEVEPSTPEAVLPLDVKKYPRNRLGLAQWTVSKENPLTARVFVNQVWAKIFGNGLVASIADFGSQGNLPSHPELLDWLAVDFVEHGWNVKRLVRQMVTSATYQQSAQMTQDKRDADPDNIYLSRASRVRLPAELIRDQILASGGLLSKSVGGPSFKPYQPNGIWEVTSSGRGNLKRYVQDHGQDLYRRGMYGFIKLTAPPPNMLVFDASNRDQCEVTRMRTNTPLQALVMMNDPVVLEVSRVFSGSLLRQPNSSDESRITAAFRRIVCRKPEPKETAALMSYYQKEKRRYQANPADAKTFLEVGEYPAARAVDTVEHAALMSVIQMMYNLEETITKN